MGSPRERGRTGWEVAQSLAFMESQPRSAVEPKYVLTFCPAPGPAQPGEGQTADLQDAPGKVLATCRFREILKAVVGAEGRSGEKPVKSIFN